jgi:hypothetical protein
MRCKGQPVERIRCEISDDGARTTIRCTDRRLVRRALTKTFRCPPEVVMQQRHDRVTGRQRQAYGGDKPCLKICDIWDRSPTAKATVKSSSGETGLHSFGHPGFPSLKTSAPSRVLQASIRILVYPQAYEGRHRRRSRSKYLNEVRFCTFHA